MPVIMAVGVRLNIIFTIKNFLSAFGTGESFLFSLALFPCPVHSIVGNFYNKISLA